MPVFGILEGPLAVDDLGARWKDMSYFKSVFAVAVFGFDWKQDSASSDPGSNHEGTRARTAAKGF
jgi:predicted solute-binding protein